MRSAIIRLAGLGGQWLPAWAKSAVYKIPVLSHGIRWLLTRMAPSEHVAVEVVGGLAGGVRLRLDLKTQKYYWLGTHELPLQRALEQWTRPGMTVFDIGAHIGFFTLGLAKLVGPSGRVAAFEPHSGNARALRENLGLNPSLAGRVRVVEAAVGDVSGRTHLYVDLGSAQGRTGSPTRRHTHTEEVEGVTLDEWVFGRGQAAPDLMKLDVEGTEGLVLAGARRLLQRARPVCLVEVHGREAALAVWEVLQAAGYEVKALDGSKLLRSPEEFSLARVLAQPR